MDPGSWYYDRFQVQPGTSSSVSNESVLQPSYAATHGAQHPFILAQQLRDAAAAHEAAQMSQYQSMALPPSLVQAAASNKSHLHQQALANLNMRESVMSVRESPRESFLTPPQTPVSSFSWKSAAQSAALNTVVVPEPHKPDPRALVNNVMRVSDRQYSHHELLANGNSSNSVTVQMNNGGSSSGGSSRPNVMRQAVELKSSQPIFPGQPPPLSRVEKNFSNSGGGGGGGSSNQPPPRQSSQVRSSSTSSSSSSNRTAFPGQAPPAQNSFLHDLQHHQNHHRQSPQQPSPQYYNNPSPQSPQVAYQQNPSPQQQFPSYHQQQQQTNQQHKRQSSSNQGRQSSSSSSASNNQTSSSSRSKHKQARSSQVQHNTQNTQHQQQLQQHQLQQQQLQLQQQHQLQHIQQREQQDLGLARLGALGALADINDGANIGNDLLEVTPSTTINYEDLGVLGNNSNVNQFNQLLNRNDRGKSEQRSSSSWLNRASELLDLSSGDSRDTPNTNADEGFGQNQQQGQQGFIPQIVMNPWDPNQAPVMTLAPLANAMQAYHQQMITSMQQQQQQQQQQLQQQPAVEEEEPINKCRVLCVNPDDEMGFLMNLPPPCNVILQPSTIGMSGKVPPSPFLKAFERFLNGEVPEIKPQPVTEVPPPSQLPGKKPYFPAYPSKSSDGGQQGSSRGGSASGGGNKRNNSSSSSSLTVTPTNSKNQRASASSSSRNHNQYSSSSSSQQGASSTVTSAAMAYNKAKKPKMQLLTDEERLECDIAVLPKRETSRRKAKENSTLKKTMKILEDDEEQPDIDMEDSDDDATWTPFKDKNASQNADPDRLRFDDDEEDFDDQSGDLGSNRKLSGFKKFALPPATSLVPEGREFCIGDFMVLKSDVDRDSAPLWRLDSKTLIQRFNAIQGSNGQWLHRSANLFSSYNHLNKANYVSVAVRFIRNEKGDSTVQVIKKDSLAGGAGSTEPAQPDPSLRHRSLAETSQFQEPFEVYIQTLISQCLDANFLHEVFQDKDEYFVSNIEKVDSVTLLRKDKIMTGISWSRKFQHAIDTWPCLNDLGSAAAQETLCMACDKDKTTTMIQMFGQPYNFNTLKTVPPSEEARMNRNFSVCKKCSRLAQLYHKLHHQKHRMFASYAELVEQRRQNTPSLETTNILNELLDNDSWLEQQFRKMQDLWADADMFVQ